MKTAVYVKDTPADLYNAPDLKVEDLPTGTFFKYQQGVVMKLALGSDIKQTNGAVATAVIRSLGGGSTYRQGQTYTMGGHTLVPRQHIVERADLSLLWRIG